MALDNTWDPTDRSTVTLMPLQTVTEFYATRDTEYRIIN